MGSHSLFPDFSFALALTGFEKKQNISISGGMVWVKKRIILIR